MVTLGGRPRILVLENQDLIYGSFNKGAVGYFVLNLFILLALKYTEIKVFTESAHRWHAKAKDKLKHLSCMLGIRCNWDRYL